MNRASQSSTRLVIALASDRDRQVIHRLRRKIYTRELAPNGRSVEGVPLDWLDAFETDVVAVLDDEIAGFVSIRRSLETSMAELPFAIDDGLYEIRLPTVVGGHRGRGIGPLLMYAALRWIESLDGHRIVAIGREELKSIYLKAGLQPLVRRVRAGAVTFELMTATVEALRCRANRQDRWLARLARNVEWDLGIPFRPPAEGGGRDVDPRSDLRRLTAAGPWRSSSEPDSGCRWDRPG